ncbi:SSI family serine proteinase inhibitor [Nocardia sp. JMUB6875]|uniref:SSI family serine proteinase inhibitor n=1 Tax=Nocardia sp. JMUB6875 TaxID=3158170 RepID=UPI0034E87E32
MRTGSATARAAPAVTATAVPTTSATTAESVLALAVRSSIRVAARTIILECGPPGGTHPDPPRACALMTKADGNIRALVDKPDPPTCPQDWVPVSVAIDGTWRGHTVHDGGTFSNMCVLGAVTATVFDF